MMRAGAHLGTTGVWLKASRFWSDRRGIAAVEFALIMPILLIMYFVTMEASQAIETSKKVSRIGSMVADLVTQQTSVVKADVEGIMKIGTVTLQPYSRSAPSITITAIQVSADGTKALVVWSRKLVAGVASPGAVATTETTVPASLKVANTFLIRVESNLVYEPVIQLALTSVFNKLPMGETYYLRPRRSVTVPCGDC
ncbi:TadE/TadG family type IV pilus assembly protein [Mesorhizobium sp. M1406]|uniref:TadE/TadG family type IV pilus assembly protein n=1 Tax=Mesorhizobium sp. M1406 TaxID=2957099 RepID=UPI0033354900